MGLVIGGLLAGVDYVASRWWPSAIGSVLVIAVLLVATGGLHFDGLLDTCDGALNPKGPSDRRLEIMRDSRSGAFAVAGGIVDLLLLWACIVDLTGANQYRALIAMSASSRAGMALAVTLFPYARSAGLGKDFKSHVSGWAAVFNVLFAGGIGFLLLGWPGAVAVLAGLTGAILAGMYLMTRLPGLTGDCYGAINEVVQVTVLLALVPLLA